MTLDRYYSGDEAWENYAAVWADRWKKCSFQDALLKELGSDLLLAQTIYALFGEHSLTWIHEKVPVLGGKTAVSRLTSKSGIRELREALMRYPYP